MVRFHNYIAVLIFDRLTGEPACNTLLKRFNLFLAIREGFHIHSRNLIFSRAAVHFTDNQILGNVNHTPGQITGISRTQGCIRQTFTGSVSRHEVFQYVKSFTEIRCV